MHASPRLNRSARRAVAFAAIIGLTAGCTTKPPSPPPLNFGEEVQAVAEGVVTAMLTAQKLQSLRADGYSLFSPRAQAVAIGLIELRQATGAWPDKDELLQFFAKRMKENAPPAEALDDLRFERGEGDTFRFSFNRLETIPRYTLSPDGTIIFALSSPPTLSPPPQRPSAPDPYAAPPREYPWNDVVLQLTTGLLLDAPTPARN